MTSARVPETPEETVSTRTRLLDAAEALFARGGIAATSSRAITRRAGANVAAVNYHFGSRQALIREVFARRLGPVNEERLAALDGVLARSGESAPPLDAVLDAFLAPALRLRKAAGGTALVRLLGRAFSEPSDEVRSMVFSQFDVVFERFRAALARALPHLAEVDVTTRFRYVIGSMAFAMAHPRPGEGAGGGDERSDLLAFLVAGLRAPAPSGAGRRAS